MKKCAWEMPPPTMLSFLVSYVLKSCVSSPHAMALSTRSSASATHDLV